MAHRSRAGDVNVAKPGDCGDRVPGHAPGATLDSLRAGCGFLPDLRHTFMMHWDIRPSTRLRLSFGRRIRMARHGDRGRSPAHENCAPGRRASGSQGAGVACVAPDPAAALRRRQSRREGCARFLPRRTAAMRRQAVTKAEALVRSLDGRLLGGRRPSPGRFGVLRHGYRDAATASCGSLHRGKQRRIRSFAALSHPLLPGAAQACRALMHQGCDHCRGPP